MLLGLESRLKPVEDCLFLNTPNIPKLARKTKSYKANGAYEFQRELMKSQQRIQIKFNLKDFLITYEED